MKTLHKKNPTTLSSWKALQEHFAELKSKTLLELFDEDLKRLDYLTITWEDFYVDVSKNHLTKKTFDLLLDVAKESDLEQAIAAYFSGIPINETEGRAVLHTALRTVENTAVWVDEENVLPDIEKVKARIQSFSEKVISGNWKGYSGKPITDIVNIGIGGSDLGPSMVTEGLSYYKNHLRTHFISNVEGDHVQEVMKTVNRETTLFVIVSKTFTTQETLSNAEIVRKWFLEDAPESAIAQHFVAVSTNLEKTQSFGIEAENVFPMKDWVGGRFSLWSAVGLSICLSIGSAHFDDLLAGARNMDMHFRQTSFDQNIPVVLALISIWYNNFWEAESEAVIPYSQYLRSLPAYLQQASMESNGKSVSRDAKKIAYQTGNIIWGASGTNAQHAFFQLMHQGTKMIPADFIGFKKSLYGEATHQQKLMANFIAQTESLMRGKTKAQVIAELQEKKMSPSQIEKLAPYKVFEGNRPSTSILINKLTPYTLGALIAMYEHKIFVQGVIWNIFSFDQWGVELGKELAKVILEDFEKGVSSSHTHDASTTGLINQFS